MSAGKIIGVGFHKTGTSSLAQALRMLGYSVVHGVVINGPKGVAIAPPLTREKVLPLALSRARDADAVCDNPFPLFYRELDGEYPGAQFILTVRDPQEWIASMLRHFGERKSETLQWIYGVPCVKDNETRCLEVYAAHNNSVRTYFATRSQDLLEIDFASGEGWPRLCTFLGRAQPRAPFPHDNTADERERKRASPWRRLKSAVRSAFAS
ncbi:MAG: sulfotransferase family protein [Alphaproteobacteria bacterium]